MLLLKAAVFPVFLLAVNWAPCDKNWRLGGNVLVDLSKCAKVVLKVNFSENNSFGNL